MIPVDQTVFGAPHGNCFAAAVASITGIPLADFPSLADLPDWLRVAREFVYSRGWKLIYVPNGCEPFEPPGFHVGSGLSPRGLDHAVVHLDGKMVHDPHPSREGVARVVRWYLLFPKATV
jgi:hypothetical protein